MRLNKRIVLLDLDGTLIDEDYHLTVAAEQIENSIKRIQSDGAFVGLNSDTPILPLRSWARCLGMNGPLIGERGQMLSHSPEEPPQMLGTMPDFFQALKHEVVRRVHEEFQPAHEESQPAFVGIGDVTEFIRQRGQIYGEDQVAVLINGYRVCSFSGYALVRQNDSLVTDPEIFDRFSNLVLSVAEAQADRLDEPDKNQTYGILILHEKGASKTRGLERLIERMGTDIEYVMIGDGDSDIIAGKYPVKLCAVGNASPALKDRARQTGGIVAKATFTRGVIEILQRLSRPTWQDHQ